MNHDMTHCKGDKCPVSEGCLRYQLHAHKAADGVEYATYIEPAECMANGNHFYIEYGSDDNDQ